MLCSLVYRVLVSSHDSVRRHRPVSASTAPIALYPEQTVFPYLHSKRFNVEYSFRFTPFESLNTVIVPCDLTNDLVRSLTVR